MLRADYIFEADSSTIDRVAFNSACGVMTVKFNSGSLASYEVVEKWFLGFIESVSLGRAYNSVVRGIVKGTADSVDVDVQLKDYDIVKKYASGSLYAARSNTESVAKDGYKVTVRKTVVTEETSIIGAEFLADAIRELQKTGVEIRSVTKV